MDGVDVWQEATLDALDGLGYETHFVDIYETYHLVLGGIHCAINVERAGGERPWWQGGEEGDSP